VLKKHVISSGGGLELEEAKYNIKRKADRLYAHAVV
jgi:hypothetical protein